MKRIILILLLFNLPVSNYSFAQNSFSINKIIITVEVQQELFPVIEKFMSQGNHTYNIPGLVTWRIHNNDAKIVQISLMCEIPGWTEPLISTVSLNPDESRELIQFPYGINLLSNHITVPATIHLSAKNDGKFIFKDTRDLDIKAVDDMVWSLKSPWDTELLLASWITPDDPMVEEILSDAKEKMPGRKFSGYSSSNVRSEIEAIFNAVMNSKIIFVNSIMNFGDVGFTQKIRLPEESISEKSANCIDGAVLFVSLFENIGLESSIILSPNHAVIGVRLARNSNETLFLETTMAGQGISDTNYKSINTFEAAVKEGLKEYKSIAQNNPGGLHIVNIRRARAMRIFPLR
jgi:hypothetical protein